MAASEEIARTLGLGSESAAGTRPAGWMAAAVVLLLLVGAGLWWTRDRPVAFATDAVTRGPLVVQVTATGTLEPVKLVEVGAEISGRIAQVHFDYNDPVEAGAVLAELDTDQLSARVTQARANLAVATALEQEARATLDEARNRAARAQELARERTFSQQDLETAQAALARAEAGLASARAQRTLAQAALEADEVSLSKAAIRSPISGIVIARNVEPGQTLASTFQTPVLFTIAEDLAEMRLHVDVDEADVGQVAPGQLATFQVDAYPNRRFQATVRMVRNAAREVQGVVTYEALLGVDNGELLLRPGMTATARIVTHELDDAVLVPNAALRFAPPGAEDSALEGQGVYRLVDGEPARVPVRVGLSDGRVSQLLEGDVAPGTPLLVDVVRGSGSGERGGP
ncbi:MAG: efflux RND transporter periplasmic adaptor subunit [Myxococcota bacterium]